MEVDVSSPPAPPTMSPVGHPPTWYFIVWRGRLLESSTGDAEGRLATVATSLEQIQGNHRHQTVRFLTAEAVEFSLWLQLAASQLEAIKAARRSLRNAFKAAGVGDPLSPAAVDVMLMLEEWPSAWRAGG